MRPSDIRDVHVVPDARPVRRAALIARARLLQAAVSTENVVKVAQGFAIPAHAMIPESLQQSRILIVDDEAANVLLMQRLLEDAGYQALTTTTDSRRVLDLYRTVRPDLILLDLMMPHLDGIAVLEQVVVEQIATETPDSGFVPVIMLTADVTPESKQRALAAGANDFLTKPFEASEVVLRIGNLLKTRRLYLSLEAQNRALDQTVKERTERLLQSEKVATMGSLLAGVAHELNNPLSGVMGFSQLMLEDRSLTPQQKNDLETIYAQSQRCKTIIQNLLQFCRRKEAVQELLNVVPLIHTTADLVRYDFSTSGIELTLNLPPSLPPVMGDANQLQQVFLNLISNARQAMEGQKKAQLTIDSDRANDKLLIRFSDNGPGISSDIQNKIFDPFFTTKAPGKGTGLGLSISYGILKNHQGDLRVESRSGEGATFIVELPIAAAAPEETKC